jgi:hypothetical protein
MKRPSAVILKTVLSSSDIWIVRVPASQFARPRYTSFQQLWVSKVADCRRKRRT